MRRFHLIEIEDESWCPAPIRDGATDYLRFAERQLNVYGPIVPRLRAAIEASGTRQVVDLCSGGGGPWAKIQQSLRESGCAVRVCMTDFHPNLDAFEAESRGSGGEVAYVATSVDATRVPAELDGFRTLFTSLHHFRPSQARAILSDAVASRSPIAAFEITERRLVTLVSMLPMPLLVMIATLFIRPFKWSRLFWTYVIPAVPILVMWDGLVSCLRTYTVRELEGLVAELRTDYDWQIGQERAGIWPYRLTYVIGLPHRGNP